MLFNKTVTIDHLLDIAWDVDTVESYCMNCKNYDVHFSCPHHQFNIPDYLHNFKHALIVVHQIDIADNLDTSLADVFHEHKRCLDPVLMSLENDFSGAKAILPGQCQNCQPACELSSEVTCPNPELLRYSYESLGFNIATITKIYFDLDLTFTANQVQLVYGYLLKEPLSDDKMDQLKGKLRGCEANE